MKRVLLLLIACSLLFSGCLDAFGPSIEQSDDVINDGALMSGGDVEDFLGDESMMNITALSESEDQLMVEIYSKELEDGELMEMTFTIAKDDTAQLSDTGLAIQSGVMGLEYRIVQGASTDVNIMVGNQWFLARDLVPQYVNPFVELESEDSIGGGGNDDLLAELTPDLGALYMNINGLTWTITMDPISFQQVATASNDTHSIMVEFLEMPPRLRQLEINSHDGNEAMKLTITWGDNAALSVLDTYPKTSVDIDFDEQTENGDYYIFSGEVDDEHVHEVLLGDIELRIGLEDSETEEFNYSLSMNVDDGAVNLTDAEGAWWAIEWNDSNSDGFVSTGDSYSIVTNSSSASDYDIRFYDSWSQSYEGGPLLGFELILLLVALITAASVRRNLLIS